MPDSAIAIQDNVDNSVREFYPGVWGGLVGGGGILWGGLPDLLPPWGTPQCDRELRVYHYMLHNQLWAGAHDIWQQKVLSTPYEISGGRNLTFKWQDIFMEGEFGQGYDELLAPFITDYLTLNRGGFMEIVSYGDPDTPLEEGARVLGLNHLDALRIVFTGNLEYPFIYYSEYTNTAHRLHRTRVIHLAHSPSPDTRMFGMGRSPLYAALSSVNAQIMLGKHQNEMLSDLPPAGLIIFTNVKTEDVQNAMVMFEAQRRKEGQQVYRAPMQIEGLDPAQPVTVTFVPLSAVPENYNRKEYMEIDVNLLALNLQLDPQDIWPLANAGLNGGEQSKILAFKTEVKGPGYFETRLERVWNRITPRPLEFKYKAQNAEQDKATADIAKVWTDIANSASFATAMEKRQLAANQIPAYADVLMDEAGNVRLPDDDPKSEQDVTAGDMTQLDGTGAIKQPIPDEMMQLPSGQQPITQGVENTQLPPKQPVTQAPANTDNKPIANPTNMSPKLVTTLNETVPATPAIGFKSTEELLSSGLITIGEAQRRMGIPVNAALESYYMLDGVPVPPDKMRDLWQSRFGRGVASFDSVIAGDPMNTNVNYQVSKEYDATKTAFTDDIAVIFADAQNGDIGKTVFKARVRSSINKYGKSAYLDGLESGGVDASEYDTSDSESFATILASQSQYVTNVADQFYTSENGFTGAIDSKATLWQSTLNEFFYGGVYSSDKNGMYAFKGTEGKIAPCSTCKGLQDTVHRMKWYVDKQLRPGVDHDNFECGTWPGNCLHFLEKQLKKSFPRFNLT